MLKAAITNGTLTRLAQNLASPPLVFPPQRQDVGANLLQGALGSPFAYSELVARSSRLTLDNNGIDTAEHGWEGHVERHGRARAVTPGYLFSVSRPDKYLWITLDNSV